MNAPVGKHNLKEIFKEKGSEFTKYGRYGKPKMRLVYINEDETEILWKDIGSKEKPRKLLVKDLETVIMGSD